jgi:hypothetical protein
MPWWSITKQISPLRNSPCASGLSRAVAMPRTTASIDSGWIIRHLAVVVGCVGGLRERVSLVGSPKLASSLDEALAIAALCGAVPFRVAGAQHRGNVAPPTRRRAI